MTGVGAGVGLTVGINVTPTVGAGLGGTIGALGATLGGLGALGAPLGVVGDDVGGSVAANNVVVVVVLGVFSVGVDVGLVVSVCTTAVGLGLGVVGATLGALGATLGGLGAALGGRIGGLGAPLGVVGKLVGKTVIVGTDVGDQVKGMVVVVVVLTEPITTALPPLKLQSEYLLISSIAIIYLLVLASNTPYIHGLPEYIAPVAGTPLFKLCL
jgi:hypothetical protein